MEVLTPQVKNFVLSYMEALDCPRSLTIAMMVRSNEWVQLFNMKAVQAHYANSDDYFSAACASDLLRKLNVVVEGVDPETAASQKWEEAEAECFRTNRRLNEIFDFGTLSGVPVKDELIAFCDRLRKNLFDLIGSGPNPTFEGRFGPGATVSDVSRRTTVLDKMSSCPTLTLSALPYMVPWIGTKWASAIAGRGDSPIVVKGNHYFTVPKNALTHRSCGKEPALNVYYQLGLGREMKKALKRSGLDLENGQDIHRQVACSASITGRFCTIDLTSASDTIASSLVRNIAPRGWFNHLDALRSPFTLKDGKWRRLEKFSSMGNGFTFELETAIFAAIAMTAFPGLKPGETLFVYGDDIIVPTEAASEVIAALKFFGFTPNESKTFVEGPFRESCGGDYWDGTAVRPYYLKELPNEPQEFISLANGINRVTRAFGHRADMVTRLRAVWFRALDNLPKHVKQCRGPQDLGDLVIHDEEKRWKIRWRSNGIRYVQVYRPAQYRKVRFSVFDPDVQFAAALYGVALRSQNPSGLPEFADKRWLVPRDGVAGYKVGWVPFS